MPVDPLIVGLLLAGLGILLLLVRQLTQRIDPLRAVAERLGALHAALEGAVHQLEQLQVVGYRLGKVEEGVGRLVDTLLGRGAGQLGEQWAHVSLSWLPEGWVRERVRMGSGEVEFAVVLPGDLLVPLDSKLVALDLVRAWEQADAAARRELERRLVRSVRERAQEIAERYLSDPRCAGFGVAAVPDPVYTLCRSALRDLVSDRIVLVPYTLLVPFVVSLYVLGQRLGLRRLGGEERALAVVRDAVQAALQELERMGQEVTTVSNQRMRALDHLRRASLALERATETRTEEGDP